MIVIPKDIPLKEDLNSYFLKVEQLFEHFQGVVDSGCVHFKSPSSEGAVYFDDENLINAVFEKKKKMNVIKGTDAIDILMDETDTNNFSVSIYKIPPERITYWANVEEAEDIHKDLSTEFTDLAGLVKKLRSEKLTGYIEIAFSEHDKAALFLFNGEWIGSASSADKWELSQAREQLKGLIGKSREMSAVLNVRSIPLSSVLENTIHSSKAEPEKQEAVKKESMAPVPTTESPKFLPMLQDLLQIYEKLITGNKKIREDFDTILKRKCVEKVDVYDFLDPFAAEFSYSKGKITYTGRAGLNQLAEGLIQCLYEIADEHNMLGLMEKHLWAWGEKFSNEVRALPGSQVHRLLDSANPEPRTVEERSESKDMAVDPEPESTDDKPEQKFMVYRGVKTPIH